MADADDRFAAARRRMVERHLRARGLDDEAVLAAMARVRREAFVPPELVEYAYEDSPLPIGEGQTISQPYVVALMTAALRLRPDDRVLEVGTGSGYAAAVLAEIATEVITVERHRALADRAREVLRAEGYNNVTVIHADGTLGWPAGAPYEGIVAAAGGPDVPASLREQLAVGGRMVIPVGPSPRLQDLVRVTREEDGTWRREDLGAVRFVPLVGAEGWGEGGSPNPGRGPASAPAAVPAASAASLPEAIAAAAEPLDGPEAGDLGRLLERIGDARVVLLGESTHGTSEFYRFRARLSGELIREKGFSIVAVEADWPDAARIDHHVRHVERPPADWRAFARFPVWMWRNADVREFVDRLHELNRDRPADDRVGFYGLDLYSLYTSIDSVLAYLDDVDPETAGVARERYGCLSPWEDDPATYGRAALTGRYRDCEGEVVGILGDLLARRLAYEPVDGDRFVDALQNARLVANAERYYKVMYYGGRESWNLRDQHMFDTLRLLLDFRGPGAKAVVWEHNSHVGDASATEMGARGEHNVGQLSRQAWGDAVRIVGFGTHAGTVAAASDWDGPMEVKEVRPSHERSYERLCHEAGVPAFVLDLGREGVAGLAEPRLERAIGVVYRPGTELASHYFRARLPRQFDDWVWFDETSAVTPLAAAELAGVPDNYPFGL